MIKRTLLTIAYFFMHLYVCIEITVFVFIVFPIIIKLLMIGIGAAVVMLAMNYPVILKCVILLLGIILLKKAIDSAKEHETSYEQYYRDRADDIKKPYIGMFMGMTLDAARSEYKTLMKKYHPDNPGGDLEMSKKITSDYEEYKRSMKETV